ncbi:M10 family metallopeptidase C-terminal domain-containing protein [Reyranella sp.]|uniref:M10 family metallopeptidase C-terminal domain-containing protein n=1 Tax=Reyranella sp. TaxID=1929291 RepID=UPI003BA8F5CD
MAAPYESEVTFLSGVAADGTVAPIAFQTWNYAIPAGYADVSGAVKWGAPTPGSGASISYFFTVASNWTDQEQSAWEGGFAVWSAIANVTFVEAADAATANFVITRGSDGGAYQRYSGQTDAEIGASEVGTPNATGSLISIDTNGRGFGPINEDLATEGGYPFSTVVHEIGHMLGLGHGGPYNSTVNNMTQQFGPYDTTLWTLMSYIPPDARPTGFFDEYPVTGTAWGTDQDGNDIQPLTPMMLDILAIQRLYGAATSGPLASGGQVFGFNSNIGGFLGLIYDFSRNAFPVLTLWDGGTNNTLDLSGYSQDAVISLIPGTFSSAGGRVNNIGIAHDTVIETARGGSGNDTIYASDVASTLIGGLGSDQIFGGAGDDILTGGADPDTIDPGGGLNTLRDTLANMDGDTVLHFGRSTTIDIEGSLIGRSHLQVQHAFGDTTLVLGETEIALEGAFTGGDFMAVARGSGESSHTYVTFETYMPTLYEGVRVASSMINGVANQPFLTGDGSVGFSLKMDAAVSVFNDSLGTYKVRADGTVYGVAMLFSDSHTAAGIGLTTSLGSPADGDRIGFFLVQNGFGQFGNMPNDLSFVTAGGATAANLNGGQPVFLQSASLGLLNDATVFHSFAAFNPGQAEQVLSGVVPGGTAMTFGFEDLASATGDNDFQDLVFTIRGNHDGLFVV